MQLASMLMLYEIASYIFCWHHSLLEPHLSNCLWLIAAGTVYSGFFSRGANFPEFPE